MTVATHDDAVASKEVPALVSRDQYFLNIENRLYKWPVSTVTREQIAELGGWDANEGVLLVDVDNNERQLSPGEVVHLKPGMEFGKKVTWKRG